MDIEDYIELLSNKNPNIEFTIDQRDVKLITSIANQINKNIALTDRQHNLLKKKIIEYREQFELKGYHDLDKELENLRLPLRDIDRSKTVKIAQKEYFDLFGKTQQTFLAIRFPYSNKMIKYIELIKNCEKNSIYDKDTKTHFIDYNEQNIFKIVDKLKDANFIIDKEILDFYNFLKEVNSNKNDYEPGIFNFEIKNVHNSCKKYSVKKFGQPTLENLFLYFDRRNILGLNHFDRSTLDSSLANITMLSKKISLASKKNIQIKPTDYDFNTLCYSLYELKRLPLLIILKDKNELDDLVKVVEATESFISNNYISVLFRLENTTDKNIQFNKTIKDLGLNNPITKNTQIVFLKNTIRLPKPLILSNWKAETTILTQSFRSHKVSSLYYNKSELIIHYDDILSNWNTKNTDRIL